VVSAGRQLPRWLLFLIAAPAAVAVWSGWVGLGGLCGFGVVHPLPGIVSGLRLDTAITLPVGVEAYGAYALGAWLTPGTPERARSFARRSAVGGRRPGARHARPGRLSPAGRRRSAAGAVAGGRARFVPAGGHARVRRRADAPAAYPGRGRIRARTRCRTRERTRARACTRAERAMGPSAGVIILSSSQKPSGVGAGDVQRLCNRYRDNHQLRFALRCGNRDVSMAILGSESYSDGYDASSLPLGDRFRGVGILYGLLDDAPTVRTHLADSEDAEVILLAARKLREKAGTLTGAAVLEDVGMESSDILADLLAVLGGDNGLWWETAAERLAEHFPDRYSDVTAEAVRSSCASRGVASVDVRWPPGRAGANRKGCRRDLLETAART
jgi:hypothetical protein